jgi:hypothetical protein
MIRILAALSVFTGMLFAQRSVPSEFMYHKVYAVVPLVGSGTPTDPQRPMLVPAAPQPGQVLQQPTGQAQAQQSGPPDLLGWQMQISDDGKFGLVEFTFQSPIAYHNFLAKAAAEPGSRVSAVGLQAISADGSNLKALAGNTAALKAAFESSIPGLKLFERGKASEAEIVAEFQKRKANYTFAVSSGRPQ